jgi:cysteinyl-tRNA synthetase
MIEIHIYNTLTRNKEKFIPITDKRVGIYTCGPTVYNYAHIGNLRTYVFEDVLKRVFKYCGYAPLHVMNVTDVGHLVSDADEGEDKIETSAQKEGKSAWDIAKFYTEAFFNDYRSLNCIMPDLICNATDHIKEMIELILKIEKNGYTYRISDGIYFDVSKFPNYGKLAGKSHIDGIKAGARVEQNPEKKNPADFALWKFSPHPATAGQKRQMEWNSPWGTGFPGWHIECSAMSMKYLGETFDVHCGGVDHIAIHHTNEIAQAESATGKKFVNYWLHGEFLVISKEEKMAKSLGNFITMSVLTEKGYAPSDYRYFCFSTHYRKQLEWTWEAMDSSQKSLSTLRENVWKIQDEGQKSGDKEILNKDASYYIEFINSITDDLNIPQSLAILWELVRKQSTKPSEKLGFIKSADEVFGLTLMLPRTAEKLSEELMNLINQRETARKNRNFKKADEIRKTLLDHGVAVEDTPQGSRWKIVKK